MELSQGLNAKQPAPSGGHDLCTPRRAAGDSQAAAPSEATARKGKRKARQFWLRQLHGWHWVSAALSLVGMLLFAITGITLNHASTISAEPVVVSREGTLPASVAGLLQRETREAAPLPPQVASEVAELVGIETHGQPGEWSDTEVYVAAPGPGSDAWVSIDRASGAITAEHTARGWISYFNDLHKGRNSGTAWFWFIDVFAVACVIFTITGLLLLQLHARHRPLTWPMVGLGLVIPLLIVVFFLHT